MRNFFVVIFVAIFANTSFGQTKIQWLSPIGESTWYQNDLELTDNTTFEIGKNCILDIPGPINDYDSVLPLNFTKSGPGEIVALNVDIRGNLMVTTGTLTTGSINCSSLIIGSPPTLSSSNTLSIPEPSTLTLLAAAMLSTLTFLLHKKLLPRTH